MLDLTLHEDELKVRLHSECGNESQRQWRTSGHDVAHILNGESRVLVLCVHPDHPVTQSAHGQYGPGWKWSSSCTRPTHAKEK